MSEVRGPYLDASHTNVKRRRPERGDATGAWVS
jgi:hypothetical protein